MSTDMRCVAALATARRDASARGPGALRRRVRRRHRRAQRPVSRLAVRDGRAVRRSARPHGISETRSTSGSSASAPRCRCSSPGVDCPSGQQLHRRRVRRGHPVRPHHVPRAIAVYERDGGIAWKHADAGARARELVVFSDSRLGNYDYGFEWAFHEDGTITHRVLLTGVMAPKAAAGPDSLAEQWRRRRRGEPSALLQLPPRSGRRWRVAQSRRGRSRRAPSPRLRTVVAPDSPSHRRTLVDRARRN